MLEAVIWVTNRAYRAACDEKDESRSALQVDASTAYTLQHDHVPFHSASRLIVAELDFPTISVGAPAFVDFSPAAQPDPVELHSRAALAAGCLCAIGWSIVEQHWSSAGRHPLPDLRVDAQAPIGVFGSGTV